MTRKRSARRSLALLAVAGGVLGLVVGVAVPGVAAQQSGAVKQSGAAQQSVTAQPSSLTSALGPLVDLGCANPANHTSKSLLPAAHVSISEGVRCYGTMRASASSGPTGLSPHQIQSAYKLGAKNAHGRRVAIVDAYDDPKVESDLAVYRNHYGLPACTTKNGCFRKVNEHGNAAPLPEGDYGWGEEITLDVEAVSAACPSCHILLVEASSAATGPLLTAVQTAVRLGAVAVSNSYGGDEDSKIRTYDKFLHHRGVAITASSGDDGYGVSWPASSPYVTAVGGTTLRRTTSTRGWGETAWSGGGSGCSKYEPKPSWQKNQVCSRRTVVDVSADADPASGLAVYGTYNSCLLAILCNLPIAGGGLGQGLDGWAQIGGTSLSSPLVASVYALAGHKVVYGSYPYTHRSGLYDVRHGSNGKCGSYLCTARLKYDGPSGLGSPKGTAGF